jgi:hypothetical protein
MAALLALALVGPAPARADSCVTPSGTIDSRPVSADGSLRSFTGDVTPFGPITGGLQLHFNPDGSYTGQFALKARGGTAYGTILGHFTSRSTYVEQMTFTGGTGRYAGIYGYAYPVEGTLNPDGTARDTVEGGQVCLP